MHLVGVWQGGAEHWISVNATTARRLQRCLGAKKRSTVPSFLTNKREGLEMDLWLGVTPDFCQIILARQTFLDQT